MKLVLRTPKAFHKLVVPNNAFYLLKNESFIVQEWRIVGAFEFIKTIIFKIEME